MPTETAPQTSAAAPSAVTPPPAATPPNSDRPISSITNKPVSEAAHKLFKMLDAANQPEKTEETPAPAAAEPSKKEEPAAAAPAKEDPPIKVSKKKEPKRPDLPVAQEPTNTPAPVPATTAATKDEPLELNDDQQAALSDAKLAEELDPKFKGLSDRMKKFFKDEQAYLAAHPDADESDEGYKKILATMPKLTAADKRVIAEARIERRVESKYKPELENIQHEIFVRDEEPKIETEAQKLRNHMAFSSVPKEILDVIKTKGLPEAQKEYADELEIAGDVINTLVEDSKELLRLTRINPRTNRAIGKAAETEADPKWIQHTRIANLVTAVCEDFQKNAPQAEQVRDGKWFVTRDEWARLAPAARHQFWTFTNSEQHVREMINRATGWVPGAIKQRIDARHAELQKRGWVRQKPTPPPVSPATPPVASSAPAAPRPSPAPAPSATPAGQRTPGQLLAARLAEA